MSLELKRGDLILGEKIKSPRSLSCRGLLMAILMKMIPICTTLAHFRPNKEMRKSDLPWVLLKSKWFRTGSELFAPDWGIKFEVSISDQNVMNDVGLVILPVYTYRRSTWFNLRQDNRKRTRRSRQPISALRLTSDGVLINCCRRCLCIGCSQLASQRYSSK
jgi:hypothetical protein